eukprot:CAMPEP_0185272832 /NCGR_PEP_ID=MMETSP1359-20130426/48200_1 /TAXON_ID=552665 /ORGANISM="Bigelowiella longifila, Strain CCMP242" /LENGTH=94 /DNA_ID=CAMNT_0027865261 /DNA_START=33 /DNA_END=317 /DNA_ORIENTATION=-
MTGAPGMTTVPLPPPPSPPAEISEMILARAGDGIKAPSPLADRKNLLLSHFSAGHCQRKAAAAASRRGFARGIAKAAIIAAKDQSSAGPASRST